MPISPWPWPSLGVAPVPSSRTSIPTSSGAYRTVTSAWLARACLSALVRPSCTIRYAERSIPGEVQFDGEPGAADLLDQRVEAVKAGLRRELDAIAVTAHHTEQTAHLRQRDAPGALDSHE